MGKYSDVLMDHFTSPRHAHRMENADRIGRAGTPGQGPFMIVYLRISGNHIVDASFQTIGCGPTIASGSVLTELVTGLSVVDSLCLTPEDLIEALDGVPADKLHAPVLAIAALQHALKDPGGTE